MTFGVYKSRQQVPQGPAGESTSTTQQRSFRADGCRSQGRRGGCCCQCRPPCPWDGGEAAAERRGVRAGRVGGPARQPGAPLPARRLDSLLLHRRVRAVRADGLLRDRVEPDDLPDGEAPPGHRGGLQQRHQLVRHRLPHAAPRRLRRRRLPRPLLDLRHRLRRLLPGDGVAGAGRLRAGAETAALQRLPRVPAGVGAAARCLLRRAVHHSPGQRRHEAQHLHHRRGPVRRLRPAGEDAQALLLQLVDVHHLPGHPLLLHRAGVPAGQRELVHRLRHPHAGPPGLHLHLRRRHPAVPPQGAAGQRVHEHGQGDRRRALELERPGARRRQGAARAGPRRVHPEAQVPDGLHQRHEVPQQGRRRRASAIDGGQGQGQQWRQHGDDVEAVHGDPGGGDEADPEAGAAAGGHVRAVHAHRADQHPVREAGHDDGPAHGPALRDPAGEPGRVRDAGHAGGRRGVRPGVRERRPAVHGQPARDHAAEADGHGHAAAGGDHGGGVGDREPAAGLRPEPRAGRHRRAAGAHRLRAPAAVRADGARRRVPGGGQARVLLRPGAGGHEEPRHRHVPHGVRHRQHPQQLPAVHGDARHAGARPRLGHQQPQRLQPRLLLRLPRRARRRQLRRLPRAQHQVQVQGTVHRHHRHCCHRPGDRESQASGGATRLTTTLCSAPLSAVKAEQTRVSNPTCFVYRAAKHLVNKYRISTQNRQRCLCGGIRSATGPDEASLITGTKKRGNIELEEVLSSCREEWHRPLLYY